MSIQKPASTFVHKALHTRPRQKYSAARAFYLTILIISAIAVLSIAKQSTKQSTSRHLVNGPIPALFTRSNPVATEGFLHESNGVLRRRDEAVRWTFFGLNLPPPKHFHQAYTTAFQSVDSSTPLETSALSSAPTAQTRKQVSFLTYNSTIASSIRPNLSPSSS